LPIRLIPTAALLVAFATAGHATDRVVLPSGASLQYSSKYGSTRLVLGGRGASRGTLELRRDATVLDRATPNGIEAIAEVPGAVLILVDSYESRPAGLSMCQAGTERFLRVISLDREPAAETFRTKLESCLQGIELGADGLKWEAASRTLHVRWLFGPGVRRKREELTLRFGAE
jgi:hypothetical protein